MRFINYAFAILFLLVFSCSQAQEDDKVVGGRCEGCEAIYEYGDQVLNPTDTLPEFSETEPKLKLTGTIYQNDGKTPASGIILYVYQTNTKGVYPKNGNEQGWGRRHGYIRGWIQTDTNGKYTFYTFRPASYPNSRIPQHIHAVVKEPGYSSYYIDDYHFEDDPFMTAAEKNRRRNRGGNGIFTPEVENGILTINRDIILGLNIPNYQ